MMEEIELVEVDEIPEAKRGGRRGIYKDIVEKFLNSRMKYALIKSNRKPITLVNGLKDVIKKLKVEGKVRVVQRQGKVYLEKIEKKGFF
jgi:predicted pyridoxine 5'-phosphate oxidase superfamily flavin-nucleotide-binding protein